MRQSRRRADDISNWSAPAAGGRGARPPRRARDPNRSRPTAEAGRQDADWIANPIASWIPSLILGATYSFPLPLGAGAADRTDRRQGYARRSPTCAPVSASLPILRLIPLPVSRSKNRLKKHVPEGTFNERRDPVHRIPCNLTPRPSDLPSGLLDSSLPGHRLQ